MMRVIAIDGPAGSGKSTVARRVADELGWSFLDTGAMYRAVTVAAITENLDLSDHDAVGGFAERCEIEMTSAVTINGFDVNAAIRSQQANEGVSKVAALPRVRAAMVERQRRFAENQPFGTVVEGRDICTVVFPDAQVKIFLTASLEARANRRPDEGGVSIQRRDAADSSRTASPLRQANDAKIIDTTYMTIDDVVREVIQCLSQPPHA